MLKPLETEYRGRRIVLECTHKKIFPPPQMYGSTDEDIDNLWRQGTISQTEYQLLKTWQEKCHLMVMGPRCLDCPLALKQNPRPGRPHVIETEPWLAAKERMRWDDMKAGRLEEEGTTKTGFVKTSEALSVRLQGSPERPEADEDDAPDPEPPPAPERDEEDAPEMDEDDVPGEREMDEDDLPDAPDDDPDLSVGEDVVDFDLAGELAKAEEEVRAARPGATKLDLDEDDANPDSDDAPASIDDDLISALADD